MIVMSLNFLILALLYAQLLQRKSIQTMAIEDQLWIVLSSSSYISEANNYQGKRILGCDPGYSCRVGRGKDLCNLIRMHASLKVASSNCRVFRSTEDHVTELFQEVNVLALQDRTLVR